MKNRKRVVRSRGVTLIEVLIVVAILSLLATGVAVGVIPLFVESNEKIANNEARVLRGAAKHWRVMHGGDCPTVDLLSEEQLIDSASRHVDPWKHPYRIRCTEKEVFVTSAGADGKDGTDDDISVPEARPGSS